MKRYEVVILMLLLISLSVVTLRIGDIRTKKALEDFNKCKVVLDHDCLEYGNCRCKEFIGEIKHVYSR